jgi:DNA-binding transcriptional LysR family regulator
MEQPTMRWEGHVGRRLKLRELYILLAVIQEKGVGKAAARLNMSQPAVSNAIAELERAIGVRLLDRSRQGVAPTPYGSALIKRAIAVFDELRQGVQDIEFLADPTAGELRIGTAEAMAAGPVLTVVNRLSRQYPRIVFHVVTGDEARLVRHLTERDVELVVTRMAGPPAEKHMNVEILFDEPLVVAAGSQNPWTRRRAIKLADLVDEPWTLFPPDTIAGAVVAEAFRSAGLEAPHATVFTVSLNMRKALLATGRFLTILPKAALTLPGRHSSLKALPVELPNSRRPTGIITLKNRTLSPLAQLFAERLRAVANAMTTAK